MIRQLLVLAVIILLVGCNKQTLYSELSERQVNEMVAVLQMAGLPAQKEDLGKGLFSVAISQQYFADAVEHLRANGYPRDEFDSLGNIFKKEGFVSSPLEEHARFVYGLSQEIAATVSSIDGVVMARVHLSVPEQNPLSDKVKASSASVFVKHRREIDLTGNISQIKSLVVNGVKDIPYDNVTVVLFPMEPMIKSSNLSHEMIENQSRLPWPMPVIAGIGGLLVLVGFVVFYFLRRKREYTVVNAGE